MLKKISTLSMLLVILAGFHLNAQNPWSYTSSIRFPDADSLVNPFLGHVDENGRVWVISTKANSVTAHNAIYFADAGDTLFTKFIDFDLNGDSDTLSGNVGACRGITSLNGSIYLSFTVPYPKYQPHTLSGMYRYDDYDTNKVYRVVASPSPTYGYGSFNHGLDITRDSIVVSGITFGTSVRMYNWSETYSNLAAFGTWLPPDPENPANFNNVEEPGGPQTAGVDLIRDVALLPGGDYTDTSVPFYTSRNSYTSTQITGGIAVWQGGTQTKPIGYEAYRIEDFDGYLSFIDVYPYGIDLDINNVLWVAGLDSTRRWVKGFEVDGINAIAKYDLPSSTSMDIPDPEGAPMGGPSDVALTKDAGHAYVIDTYSKAVWVFKNNLVSVEDNSTANMKYALAQNYPNPFNPSTIIKFNLANAGNIKLTVSDMLGKEVAVLAEGFRNAGNYSAVFDSQDLSTGVYFYTLTAGDVKISKKMLLIK